MLKPHGFRTLNSANQAIKTTLEVLFFYMEEYGIQTCCRDVRTLPTYLESHSHILSLPHISLERGFAV